MLRNALRRGVGITGGILGQFADEATGHQAGTDTARDTEAHEAEKRQGETNHRNGGRTAPERQREGFHQGFHVGIVAAAHEEATDDGQNRADTRHNHGGGHEIDRQMEISALHADGRSQRGGGQNRTAIRFVQIGTHAGDVADVVADIVRDGGRVARVVFGDAGFHLADQVGAHIGRLGVDAAADTGEEGLGRGPHAEGDHRGGHMHQFFQFGAMSRNNRHAENLPGLRIVQPGGRIDEFVENDVPQADVEQTQAHHDQTHHRSRTKGDPQTMIEILTGTLGRPGGGIRRGAHAEIPAQAAEQTPGQEGDGNKGILNAEKRQHGQNDREAEKDHRHDLVLAKQIRHGTLAHVAGDLFHAVVALAGPHHILIEVPGHTERHQAGDRSHVPPRGRHADRLGSALRGRERHAPEGCAGDQGFHHGMFHVVSSFCGDFSRPLHVIKDRGRQTQKPRQPKSRHYNKSRLRRSSRNCGKNDGHGLPSFRRASWCSERVCVPM